MRIMVLGSDGYLGWPTCMHFSARGHEVCAVDNLSKRNACYEISVEPLGGWPWSYHRHTLWTDITGKKMIHSRGDVTDYEDMRFLVAAFEPDTIIHYAEQPSAPYSHISRDTSMATQGNNILGTLNLLWVIRESGLPIHLVKLGTMGEYGTPNIDIEEGWIDLEYHGRRDRMLYPKKPGSWYHASKVCDSVNIEYACRAWGLAATDLNQGIVYGASTEQTEMAPELGTTFFYDAIFGTALNRFLAQAACGESLTVYGNGSQIRGYLNILDTLQCVELACLNPAKAGEFRVFNQYTELFSVLELARRVSELTGARIEHIENPRVEQEDHYYNPTINNLLGLGMQPHRLTDQVLEDMFEHVAKKSGSIDISVLRPEVMWR